MGEYKKNNLGEFMPTNTRELGSSLMEIMLKEVSDFCDPSIKENWSLNPHQQVRKRVHGSLCTAVLVTPAPPPLQLIYDIKDGGASLDLITLHADKMTQAERTKFTKIGVIVPSMM